VDIKEKEYEGLDWIHLTLDKTKSCNFVEMLKHFWGAITDWEFLDQLRECQFKASIPRG
jgi:hypothetical protein